MARAQQHTGRPQESPRPARGTGVPGAQRVVDHRPPTTNRTPRVRQASRTTIRVITGSPRHPLLLLGRAGDRQLAAEPFSQLRTLLQKALGSRQGPLDIGEEELLLQLGRQLRRDRVRRACTANGGMSITSMTSGEPTTFARSRSVSRP
ncbi:hypothetical protein AB4039_11760 [Streptomyces sp. M-16]|uniref:hypothetical protein n=1 Tax=Streptomyces sp. M-16 TaxID=3233040 RepID=UPI003F95AC26